MPRTERRNLSFGVTAQTHRLFTDFAAYNGERPRIMARRLAEANTGIIADVVSAAELDGLQQTVDVALGPLTKGLLRLVIDTSIAPEAYGVYKTTAERLGVDLAPIARVAVVQAWVGEMLAEKFTF